MAMNYERLLRFQHPQKVLGYLGRLDDERLAVLFGIGVEEYRAIRHAHDEAARGAAEELLADPEFARRVERLPFEPGQKVVAVGESTTADLRSWFEILRHLLAGRKDVTLVNLGVSGQTTTQALAALPGVRFQRPDWVLCLLGGNDSERIGGQTLVSVAETERNLRTLREQVDARWVWIAPTPVDEERVAAYEPFRQLGIGWHNDDIEGVTRVMEKFPEQVVTHGRPDLMDDGLHLTLAGQQEVARTVVEALTP